VTSAPHSDDHDAEHGIPAPVEQLDGVDRLRFLGHATVVIELDGARMITDPVLRGRLAHLRRHTATPDPALHDQPIDAVLISHLHHDHLDHASLNRFGGDVRLIVPTGAGQLVRRWGFRHVEELAEGKAIDVAGVRVRATPANHSGRRTPFGPRAACLGYLVEGSRRIYFAGDTGLFPEMAALSPIDVALLPVWGWGPNIGPGHLDPYGAAVALTLLHPSLAIPVHWGTFYPIGLRSRMRDLLRTPPEDFARHASELAPEVAVRILAPGEALTLTPLAKNSLEGE
jgi:L-ascorbate metabolism protein UlaG (beta-lactamase superfamily)